MTSKVVKKYTPKKIKNNNLELKKPSELCQVLFFSDFNNNEYAQLTSMQIDLASTMFYLISDVMNKQKLTEADIFEWSSLNHFEINLQTIAEMLGKYENGYYEPIVSNLQELSKVQVLTNTLHKNKSQEQILFHLIRKISWLKDKQTTNKRVKVWIEPELLSMFHNVNKMYTSFYLQIQYGLNSKYAKLLYEVLKDYAKLGELTLDFTVLKALMNIDINEKPDWEKWSSFNRDILKRAVKEVSDKADIHVTYEPVKERVVKKLEVTKVKFTIKKQKSILIDYEEYDNNLDVDACVVADDIDECLSIEEIKFMKLAHDKMNQAKLYGTVIKNENRYLDAVVAQLKKDNVDVTGMITIDEILDEIKDGFNKVKSKENQLIVLDKYDSKYPVIAVSQEYLLYSPVDRVNITQTIDETINKINVFKNKGGQFKLIQTPGYVTELEISYL
jgi:plasmid replication initiation protein